jgi:hypothetical protein
MALPDYLEDTAKDFAKQSVATYSAPIETSTFTGGLDAQGNRAAGAGITGVNPFVAGMDPLQSQAIGLATQGVGSYSPFLQSAQGNVAAAQQNYADQAGFYGNQTGLTGPNAYQNFMSPYQQQVIDSSLAGFDSSRVADRQAIQDQAVASGNFGGGREGAMLGQYDADSNYGRSALQAQLQSQGFNQANTNAQQAFQNQGQMGLNQFGLANQQFGLSNFDRTGMGQDISALGNLGSLSQGINQANLTANQNAAKTAAYEPYGRLHQYGAGLTGLAGGMANAYAEPPAAASPLNTAINSAIGVGGLFGKIYG